MSLIELTEVSKLLALPIFLIRDFISYDFNGKKLQHSPQNENMFDIKQVNEFRIHLDSHWPDDQREPPNYIKRFIKYESGNVCSLCHQHKPKYQYAHIKPWARTHSHNPHNLLYLCLDCHATEGNNQKLLIAVKEELIKFTNVI
jgi:hypothetical protein